MKVILVPLRLRLASGLILFSVPLSGLQVVLLSGAPWWDLPYRRIGFACALAAALFVPLVYWVCDGRRWALWLSEVTGTVWFAASLLSAMHFRGFWLGLFVVFLGMYWLGIWVWLKRETGKSFFDPRMSWYHGSPEKLPELTCEFENVDQPAYRVCRMDREGVFVFQGEAAVGFRDEALLKRKRVGLLLSFKGRQFRGTGTFIRVLGCGKGYGLRFDRVPPDDRKKLGDFVELLKGEGYA